jgi:riboflavin synthase
VFTGIVQDVGRVISREQRRGDVRMGFLGERLDPAALRIGDSICVQGCCLTVVAVEGGSFLTDVSRETLRLTTLGQMQPGARVNLEPALKMGDPLGGHLLTGHVDGLGQVVTVNDDARSCVVDIAVADDDLMGYIARKGSIAVDGVSLTVNMVHDVIFRVNLIPHTRDVTTLGRLEPDDCVNIEVDLMARYVARLLESAQAEDEAQEEV